MDDELRQAFRDVVRGAGIVSVGMFLEYFLAFIAQVIAASYLSVASFGGIITGTAIIDVGMLLGSLGLGTGVARFLPRADSDHERLGYLHTAGIIVISLSSVIGLGVALNAGYIAGDLFNDPAIADSVFVFGLTIPAAALLTFGLGGLRGLGISRYRVYIQNITQPLSRFFLVVLVTFLGLDQLGIAIAYTLPYVIGACIALWSLRATLGGFRILGRIDRAKLTELVEYSAPQSVGSIAWFLVRSVDIFLIGAMLGSHAVGVYGVAYGLAQTILIFSTAFNFLGMPVSSALDVSEDRSKLLRINEAIVRWLIVLGVPVIFPFLVYAPDLLRFIYKPAYAEGGLALAILAVGFGIHNVMTPAGSLLKSTGRTEYSMVNNVVAAVVNFLLNLLLIPRYHIVGAAIATFVSYLLADLLAAIEIQRFEGFTPLTRNTLIPALLSIPVLFGGAQLARRIPVDPHTVVSLTAVVGMTYFALFVILVGFLPEEVVVAKEAQDRFGISIPGLDRVLDRFS